MLGILRLISWINQTIINKNVWVCKASDNYTLINFSTEIPNSQASLLKAYECVKLVSIKEKNKKVCRVKVPMITLVVPWSYGFLTPYTHTSPHLSIWVETVWARVCYLACLVSLPVPPPQSWAPTHIGVGVKFLPYDFSTCSRQFLNICTFDPHLKHPQSIFGFPQDSCVSNVHKAINLTIWASLQY